MVKDPNQYFSPYDFKSLKETPTSLDTLLYFLVFEL